MTGASSADFDEVELAYELGQVEVHTRIDLRALTWYNDKGDRLPEAETRMVKTTVGRVLFNRILPPEVQFSNEKLDKGAVKDLIADVYELCGQEKTTDVADRIKSLGFEYAMRSGTTLAVADISIPPERKDMLDAAQKLVEVVERDFRRGLLTEQEQNERIIEIWQRTTEEVAQAVKKHMDPDGNLSTMASSGATKGGFSTISQLAGMRGLMADPAGRIIPLPIRSNFRQGLTALEYFISMLGLEAAHAVAQDLRQHRDRLAGQIDRIAAKFGFLIERRALRDEVADVGNVNAENPAALLVRFETDRVVEILRIRRVDGHDHLAGTVLAFPQRLARERSGGGPRLLQGLGFELARQMKLMDHRPDLRVILSGSAEHLDDHAASQDVLARIGEDFHDDFVFFAGVLGGDVLDDDRLDERGAVGLHQPGLRMPHQGADEPVVRPLHHGDDLARVAGFRRAGPGD